MVLRDRNIDGAIRLLCRYCGPYLRPPNNMHLEVDEWLSYSEAEPLYCNAHSTGDWRGKHCDDHTHPTPYPTPAPQPHPTPYPSPAPTPRHCAGDIEYRTVDGWDYPICGPSNEDALGKKLRCPDDACCSKWGVSSLTILGIICA